MIEWIVWSNPGVPRPWRARQVFSIDLSPWDMVWKFEPPCTSWIDGQTYIFDVIVTSSYRPVRTFVENTVGKDIACWAKLSLKPMSGNELGKSYMPSTSVKNHRFRVIGRIDVKKWKSHNFLAYIFFTFLNFVAVFCNQNLKL